MKNLTYKQVVKILLPYVETAVEKVRKNLIEFDKKNDKGYPCRYEYFKTNEGGEIFLVCTDEGDTIVIEAKLQLEDKHDYGTLYVFFEKETKEVLFYFSFPDE